MVQRDITSVTMRVTADNGQENGNNRDDTGVVQGVIWVWGLGFRVIGIMKCKL